MTGSSSGELLDDFVPNMDTARNNSCVGYQGNSVYHVAALIPVWVSVTHVAIW
jgi:hypothetical protein